MPRHSQFSPEALEVMDWAFKGGCSDYKVCELLNDVGVKTTRSAVRYHMPGYKEYNAERNRKYRDSVLEKKIKDSPRYMLTPKAGRFINIGHAADFSGGTMGVLECLKEKHANEYEIVGFLQEKRVYKAQKTRGRQLGFLRKTLRSLQDNGLIRARQSD